MTLTRTILERCQSWARHSGKTREAMAAEAGVHITVIKRLRQNLPVSVASLERVEAVVPLSWSDPMSSEKEVV